MKRTFLSLFLIAVASFIVTGCQGESAPKGDESMDAFLKKQGDVGPPQEPVRPSLQDAQKAQGESGMGSVKGGR